MKIIYLVVMRNGEVVFTSPKVEECEKYIADNNLTFSALLRKRTIF